MNPPFIAQLIKLHPCPQSIAWIGLRTLREAWEECDRADWMAWLIGKLLPREVAIPAFCACARILLHRVPVGEDRPRVALDLAEAFARGEVAVLQVREAVIAAFEYGVAFPCSGKGAALTIAYAARASYEAELWAFSIALRAHNRDGNSEMCAILRSMVAVEALEEALEGIK